MKKEVIMPIGFGIKGGRALLKAFIEEVIAMGWRHTHPNHVDYDSLYFNISDDDADLNIGSFWYASLEDNHTSFYLPDQWHEAIEMAKESLPKPKIKFKEGDWVWHEQFERAFYVINPMTSNLMWLPNYVSSEAANNNEKIFKRYATKEEAAYHELVHYEKDVLSGKYKCYYFDNVWKELDSVDEIIRQYIKFNSELISVGISRSSSYRKRFTSNFAGIKIGCKTFSHDTVMKIAKQLGITT